MWDREEQKRPDPETSQNSSAIPSRSMPTAKDLCNDPLPGGAGLARRLLAGSGQLDSTPSLWERGASSAVKILDAFDATHRGLQKRQKASWPIDLVPPRGLGWFGGC